MIAAGRPFRCRLPATSGTAQDDCNANPRGIHSVNVSSSPHRAAGSALRAAVLCAVAATFWLAAAAPAASANTFVGTCLSIPATGSWPVPLTFTPRVSEFDVTLDGGSCSGTLNGQAVQGVPFEGNVAMIGLQSCSEAVIDGRAHTTIGGKTFDSTVHERRTGRDAVIVAQADGGGAMVVKAYGRIGLISDSDPLAQDPYLRPLAEPTTAQQFFAACSGSGLTGLQILVEVGTSPTGISS
jgi:hypothetical protein